MNSLLRDCRCIRKYDSSPTLSKVDKPCMNISLYRGGNLSTVITSGSSKST